MRRYEDPTQGVLFIDASKPPENGGECRGMARRVKERPGEAGPVRRVTRAGGVKGG